MDEITKIVDDFETKNKKGFVGSEIAEILKKFPDINVDKFYNALRGTTCIVVEGEIVTYHCDIETALRCGVEDRDINFWEWD